MVFTRACFPNKQDGLPLIERDDSNMPLPECAVDDGHDGIALVDTRTVALSHHLQACAAACMVWGTWIGRKQQLVYASIRGMLDPGCTPASAASHMPSCSR